MGFFMKWSRWKVLTLCLCMLMGEPARLVFAYEENKTESTGGQEQAAMDTELYARGAVLMDGDSGRILYGKNASDPMPMASTTKIMTCILALEQGDAASQACTVSAYAASQPQVKLGMVEGDTFYLKDLLYSLMLESHNDTAVCIAEHVGGSVEGFAAMMNEKAAKIGCRDTHYITPNGLDAQDEGGTHHTTAAELARVMRYCIVQSPMAEAFLEITRTDSYTFSNIEGTRSYGCTNHNAFLHMMEGALTGKTGFTGNAGYCYVGAARQDDKLLIVALLACGWPNNKRYKWKDTRKLMEYGFANYEKREIGADPPGLPDIPVEDGKIPFVPVKEKAAPVTVLMRRDEQAGRTEKVAGCLTAPVEEGQEIGTVEYSLDGIVFASFPVVTVKASGKIDYPFCLEHVLKAFFL